MSATNDNESFCGPIRIFIGSSPKNVLEETVFIRSLRSHTTQPLEINTIDGCTGSVHMQNGEVKALPTAAGDHFDSATAFSFGRFAIPQWCDFKGRAIYCDSDQLAFNDISDLWKTDLGSATAAAVRVADAICATPYRDEVLKPLENLDDSYFLTSVMLINCARAKQWNVRKILRYVAEHRLDYVSVLWFGSLFRTEFSTTVTPLSPVWNCLEKITPDARLVHFTDLKTQPWLFPHNPIGHVWEQNLFEAVDAYEVTPAMLASAYRQGGINLRTRWSALAPRIYRHWLNYAWKLCEGVYTGIYFKQLCNRVTRGIIPDVTWHWRRNPSCLRRLRWALSVLISSFSKNEVEITALVYSEACKRTLLPVAMGLAESLKRQGVVTVVLRRKLRVSRLQKRQIIQSGCHIDTDGISLMRACRRPSKSVVLLCLDHRRHLRFHRLGIAVAGVMKRYGVPTVSLQHGGTHDDSIASLASSASNLIMVWGHATVHRLIRDFGWKPERILITGNPLHDRLNGIFETSGKAELARLYPEFWSRAQTRKIVLLATTIQREYSSFPDEQERYRRYLYHIYQSLDFSRVCLVIKAHPNDFQANRNLYQELLPPSLPEGAVAIIPPEATPDVYALLNMCDVLMTRMSTVAEEAIILGKPVVAFDLEPPSLARKYAHLSLLGFFRIVSETPPDDLATAVREALEVSKGLTPNPEAIKELTYALDGKSLDRAVRAILEVAGQAPRRDQSNAIEQLMHCKSDGQNE